ncbi:DEAD-box ATP-dependent RNA helicase 36 [Ananas comosus]|uniref:DEAD-box ATP-dependent RNA helicase 36 n=1 Tax=Ananas comosus TaxID=4615 RepID=A0A199UPP3_ANACO|nr:DEAD-box ATP-dependent RNA helicase 36 [Ananas comosus]
MTDNLQSLLEISAKKSYFFEEYKGFKTVESLKQQNLHIPPDARELYLFHILTKMVDDGIRSAIVFVSTCRTGHFLGLLLEELDQDAVALHSHKSQSLRLASLQQFRSGRVRILLATDVASRGLDIPTVDLVINYDVPRYPQEYVHRVGHTARAGRGGQSISFVTEVFKARLVEKMKMLDEGFEEQVQTRKEQKLKRLAEKGLLKKWRRKA